MQYDESRVVQAVLAVLQLTAEKQGPVTVEWKNVDFDVMNRLHELGLAHSVEAWSTEGELVGGLYGLGLGAFFAGESMFYRERDASKVALVGLVELMRDEDADQRLVDVQWQTPHLASLGVVEISRGEDLARLPGLLDVPQPQGFAEGRATT